MDGRWYPEDRGYDDRDRDERRDDRREDRRDDRRDERGYTPTRYADDRDYDDNYRVPEPRGARGYGADPLGNDTGEMSGESVSRARRSEAIDRSALQRPVSGGAPTAPPAGPPMSGPPMGGPAMGGPAMGGSPMGGPPMSGPPMSGPPTGGMPLAAVLGGPTAMPTVPTGPPFEPVPPQQMQHGFAAPTALTAAVPAPAEQGGAVYRSKRPGLAVALVALTVLFEIPVLRLFWSAVTADQALASATLAGIFMIAGLPMFALGLYGLIGGAAGSAPGWRAWTRTPLAYLPIALLLFLAAALST